MKSQSVLTASNAWQAGLILVAGLAAVAVGISGLFYASPFAPALVGVVIIVVATIITWLRKPVWALYTALFVVLLPIGLIPPEIHSQLNRALTIIALVAWLFDVITRQQRVAWTSAALVMVGFLVWAFVTLFWAPNLSLALNALQMYALRLILFLVLIVNEIRTKADLNGLMKTLALTGWVLIVVGVATLWRDGYTPGMRFQVLDMNENQTGILVLLALPGVLWQARWAGGRHHTLRLFLSFLFIALALLLAILSGSRGSAISILISLVALWFWKPTRLWGQLGLLCLVAAILLAPSVFFTLLERFAIEPGDTLLGGREPIWQAAWLLIRDHLFGGVGIGNGPYEVLPYLRLFRGVSAFESAAIHNPILTVWAETGIPGLMLYLGILAGAVGMFIRQYCRHKQAGIQALLPYYALISSAFLGYMASWIKGGGMESDFSYFLMLALLLLPGRLNIASWEAK